MDNGVGQPDGVAAGGTGINCHKHGHSACGPPSLLGKHFFPFTYQIAIIALLMHRMPEWRRPYLSCL
jgi:hypothetical protein